MAFVYLHNLLSSLWIYHASEIAVCITLCITLLKQLCTFQIHVVEGSHDWHSRISRPGTSLPLITITSYEMARILVCDKCVSSYDYEAFQTVIGQMKRDEVKGDQCVLPILTQRDVFNIKYSVLLYVHCITLQLSGPCCQFKPFFMHDVCLPFVQISVQAYRQSVIHVKNHHRVWLACLSVWSLLMRATTFVAAALTRRLIPSRRRHAQL